MSDNESASGSGSSDTSSDEGYMMSKHEFEILKEKWTSMVEKGTQLYSNFVMRVQSLKETDPNDVQAVKFALETLGNAG